MSAELNGVIIGGVIGILGGLGTTLLLEGLKKKLNIDLAKTMATAEVVTVKKRTQRLADGRSSFEQFRASSSTLLPITSILSYLCPEQLSAFLKVIALDNQVKTFDQLVKASLLLLDEACEQALELFE